MIGWTVSKDGTKRYYRRIDAVRYRMIIMTMLRGLPMPYQCTTVKRVESDSVRPGFGRGFLEVV